jgi:hypothetical protein
MEVMKMNSKKETISLRSISVFVLVGILGAFIMIPPSYAVDYYWVGGSGSWHDPLNWNPNGLPSGSDNVFLTQSDAINRTVENSTGASAYQLNIDATGTGTMTLNILEGGMGVNHARIGIDGVGIIYQFGGTVGFSGAGFSIGGNPGSMGIYNLIGGFFGSKTDTLSVGWYGTGIFDQTGGSAWLDSLYLGEKGTFNLSGGTLLVSMGDLWNKGTLNQTGGSLTSEYFSNYGKYNWGGGDLRVYGGKFYDIQNYGITNLSGAATRTAKARIQNDGTWKVTNTTAVYTGSFTNNGSFISDSSINMFTDLIIGENGYMEGDAEDLWYVGGKLLGIKISAGTVTNISGSTGMQVYYLPSVAENSYLMGLTYNLLGGGKLIPTLSGDFDGDSDVDGSDLAALILGNVNMDITAFALVFGRGN